AQAIPGDNGASTAATPTSVSRRAKIGWGLVYVGLVAVSAGIAFAVVRATLTRAPVDPTTERIQSLIDEANRLLQELDDKKPG
ncbi:MAG TPA: hypothetical protein VME66_09505, partial [Candidatus Acidoferrales bacterium]|nr:hypothetical protein [Candidatus Acidoferrales bacterium]